MSLKFATGGSSNDSSLKMEDGVYVAHGTILTATAGYNCTMIEGGKYADDIALRLTVDIGKDWNKDVYVGGNFKRKQSFQGGSQIVGWGSAFKVSRVFGELNIEGGLTDDYRIPEFVLDAMVGKTLVVLSFRYKIGEDGKDKFADYALVTTIREGEEPTDAARRLHEEWKSDSYAQKRFLSGSPDSADNFGFGPAPTAPSAPAASPFSVDDNLPF